VAFFKLIIKEDEAVCVLVQSRYYIIDNILNR
jgi:hypothetical protein